MGSRSLRIEPLENRRLLALTQPVEPAGSLAYSHHVTDVIAVAGEVDALTVNLDAGQTLSVAVDPDSTLTAAVEVLDPSSALLAGGQSSVAGSGVLLQTFSVTTAGAYTIRVRGAGSTVGNYDLSLTLNAAVEAESVEGSPNNDSVAAAQDIDGSFLGVGTGGAERGAVIGQGDGGPDFFGSLTQVNNVYAPNVLTFDFTGAPLPQGDATLTITAIADLDTSTEFLTLNAEGVFSQNLFVTGGQQQSQVSTQVTIPQAMLSQLAADGKITFTVTPSASVNNLGNNQLKLDLQYSAGAGTSDWFSFTLQDGQSTSLMLGGAGVPFGALELYDANGTTLLTSSVTTSNVYQVISNFVDASADGLPNRYYARVTGVNGQYNLVAMRDADFDTEDNDPFVPAQDITLSGAVLGNVSQFDHDHFRISVNAGDTLQFRTATPGDQPFEFENLLNVGITVFDPTGAPVPYANGPGNESFSHLATLTGDYTIHVFAENATLDGTYVLEVSGHTGTLAPLTVASTSPPNGGTVANAAPLTQFLVNLSSAVHPGSIDPADLLIDGNPALGVTVVDADTLAFDLPALGDGLHTVSLAAGALANLQAVPLAAYSGSFTLDNAGPRVVSSSIQDGDVISSTGPFVYVVKFDEPLLAAGLGAEDLILIGAASGAVALTSFNYDGGTSTLTVQFPQLVEDSYTLTLLSGGGGFNDTAGNDLDGELLTSPIGPNASGDGIAGGNFVLRFGSDDLAVDPFPVPLSAIEPTGSLIYAGSVNDAIAFGGDQDEFSLNLEAGQVVSIVVQGSGGLIPQVVLETPNLQTTTATAAGPNGAAVLQAIPTALAGTYKIRVAGIGGAFGGYSVRVVLNAALEAEAHGGPSNNNVLSAQNLDNSFIGLGFGSAARGAVVGTGAGGSADFYQFSLAPNQSTSLALNSQTSGGAILELRDAAGNLLAAGSNSANYTRTIDNFVAATGGVYYVSVVGATGEYSLLVTRDADVDAESNNDLGSVAQDITLSGTVVGAVTNGVIPPSGGGTPVTGPIDVNGSPLSLGFAVDGSFVGSAVGARHNGVEYLQYGTYLATYTVAFNGVTYTNAAPSNSSAFAVLLEDLSSGSQHVIRATGTIIPNVRFERIVSWKDGDDHAAIFTKITNDTGAPLNNVAVLENIDPDPGAIYNTNNDVTAAGQLVVGASAAGAIALGSTDPRAVLSAEDFFITDPFAVINSPVDPNGASGDVAINLGFNIGTLAPGATEAMAAVMIFGANKAAVEATYASVASTTTTGDVDSYSFQANAGDALTIATNRPAAGPGEFVNNLDLAIELYDPLGNLVASDSAGALTYLAAMSGSYTVRVLAESDTEGEYVLNVSGHAGALAPFEVTTSSPADGDHVLVAPAEVTLDFSDAILLSSVDAADLSVNGVAATNVIVVDGNTLRFTLPPAVEGANNVVIAGGALTDLQGQPLEPFSITYDLDLTAPRVIASSLLEGASISSSSFVYTAQFDDPLVAAFLDASDVQLLGQFSGSHAPTSFNYDAGSSTLTVEYSGLAEDLYTLTLLSGAGRFVDQFGRGLDGEPAAIGTVPSGDGVPGGNFVVHFGYDDSTAHPFPVPLSPVQPLGSAVHTGEVNGTVEFAGDQDRFSISLEKNQTISIAVRGSGGLVPRVSLSTPGSPLVAVAVATGPNGAAVLQSIPTTAAGNYVILVEGAAGTTGSYEIALVLNAGLEQENYDGSDNGLQADAQDLDPAFQNRGTIGAAVAAVVGRGDLLSGPVYADSQTQNNIVSQPNVLTYNFASAPLPIGDAVLTVTAYADLDTTSEYLRLEAEGILLQDLFVTGGSQSAQVTTQVTIPLATLALLAADGTITMTVTPSPSVGNIPGNFLTFSLEYPTGSSVGGDWYEFSLEDGETASLALDAPDGTVLELFDAAGNVLATGVETFNLAQAISNFADQTNDGVAETYYARITVGAGPYNLVVTRNSDFDAEPNQDFDNAQDVGGVSGVSGHIIASPSGSTPLGPLTPAFGSGANSGSIPVLQTFAGPGYSNGVPPDPTLAAGPEQVVAIVNTSIGVYDKSTGSQLLLQSLNGSSGFFGSVGATTTVFDPWVLYDTESERFFAIAIDIASSSSSFLYIAVSTDSTPVSGSDWHKYRIPYTHTPTAALGSGVHFADYPKLGVNDDAIWISGNYFPISSGSGVYAGITAIEKNALLGGGAVNILYQEFFNGFSVMPMTQYDSGSTQYFAESSTDGGNSIRIHAVSNALTTPTRTTANVAVPSFLAANDVPQLGGGAPADSIDARIMTGVWRDGSMWFAHAIIDPAVDSEAVVRWYEVATNDFPAGGSPTLLQSGNIDPGPGVHTWMPALSVDGNGNMAAGFSVGGPNQYLGAGFTGRLAGDAPGTTVLPITEYATGLGTYQIVDSGGRNRWGDYSGLAIDPTSNGTFWVFNEYPTAVNTWATQIASFQLQQEVDEDWYQFGVNAGDILRIQTSTPGSGVGQPENFLDPSIQLLDPSGNVVASASHVGNELLFHAALATGQYRVRVFSETTGGEYFLQVEGATGGSLAPTVIDADPDVNAKVNAFPLTYTLSLSEATLPSSLQASDLLIGGLPAVALTVIDAQTLEFTIDPNANVGSGVYQVALAAGAVQDLQGIGNAAFITTFEVDVTPPVIIDTFWNGSPLKVSRLYNEGSLTFQALFSEDLFLAGSARRGTFTPGTDDVFVTNAQTGAIVYPLTVAYDPATDRLTAEFGTLSEGDYVLTIRSGSGSVEDQVGNDLDGDPLGAGLDGTTTGDGIAGGNYTVAFSMDRTSPAPLNPFVAVEPLGGLIAGSQNNAGFINLAGDQEIFEYVLEAGQLLSAILRPANPLATLTVQLVGVTSIFTAAAPGQAVVLPLTALAATGLYELRVSGDAKGAFSLDVVMNAAIEPGSDSADGQELAIDNSLVDLGSGRYAVLGRSTAAPPVGSIVANGSFETGNFSGWSVSTAPRGASPLRNWTVSTAGNGINTYGLVSTEPQDGSFVAWNGFDGSALMEYVMSQDVTLPAGPGPLLLSWQDRVQWNFTLGALALQPRLYDVQIRNPSTNAVLATLHSFSTDVEAVNPTGDTGWQTHSASLAAFAGQTVRLYFVEKIPESSTGPGQFEIDNVSITSPGAGGPDADEYTLDLSGKAGSQLDVVLAGLDGADFSGQLLELLDDAGNILATASAAPLGPGVDATNFDLGIRDFVIPNIGSNVYTLRLHSAVPGKYSLVVTEDLIFDTEPNQSPTGPLRSLDQAGALGYLSAETSLAAGQIEPDDYANGTVLNTIVPGVTLSVNGSPTSSVTATTSPYTPPGSRGFGADGSPVWSSSTQLDASFAVLTNQASITVGSDDASDVSFLSAYDSSGNLLATVTSASLSSGQTQVLTINRPTADIASLRAGGVGGDAVYLDHLQFNAASSSNTGDAYEISLLAGQSVTIFTETPLDGASDLPANSLNPKLKLLDATGQVLASDANSRDGKNAELTFTATVAGNYVVRVEQETGDGAYVLRADKGLAGADFDQNGWVDGGDFLAWQRGFGIVAPNAVKTDGDVNNDFNVDGNDLAMWKEQYGAVAAAVPTAAATFATSALLVEESPAANGVDESSNNAAIAYRAAIDAAMAMSLLTDQTLDGADAAVESVSLLEQVERYDFDLAVDDALPRKWSAADAAYMLEDLEAENDAHDVELQWISDELLEQVFG